MNVPTVQSPWFILQKQVNGETFYYQDNAEKPYSVNTSSIFYFLTLKSAARVADEEKVEVRAIYSKAQLKEFGWEEGDNA